MPLAHLSLWPWGANMRQFLLLIFFTILFTSWSAHAETTGLMKVSSSQGKVWLERGGKKKELINGVALKIGDHLVTQKGSALIRFQKSGSLLIRPESDMWVSQISYKEGDKVSITLAIHLGETCIELPAKIGLQEFVFQVGEFTQVTLNKGAACVTQQGSVSLAQVLRGTIQIQHKVNPDMVMLSEVGARYLLWNDGRSKLITLDYRENANAVVAKKLSFTINEEQANSAIIVNDVQAVVADSQVDMLETPAVAASLELEIDHEAVPEVDKPEIEVMLEENILSRADMAAKEDVPVLENGTESDFEDEIKEQEEDIADVASEESEAGSIEVADVADLAKNEQALLSSSELSAQEKHLGIVRGKGRYTVFLFSTRLPEKAESLNHDLHKASYPSEVREKFSKGVMRYRVAVSDFVKKKDAENFSNSIKGRYGITGTWIAERP